MSRYYAHRFEEIGRNMLPSKLPEPTGLVACDTETSGLHPDPPENGRVNVVSVAWRSPKGVIRTEAFPFGFGETKGGQGRLELEANPNLSVEEWRVLLDWLGRRRLVFHGAKFDLRALQVGTTDCEGADLLDAFKWDTMLVSRDTDQTEDASLEALEARIDILSMEDRAAWRESKKKRAKVNDMPWKEARQYAATDAYVTLVAAENQLDRIESGDGDWMGIRIEFALCKVLVKMERRGIGIDAALCSQIAMELRHWEGTIAKDLPFVPTVPKARTYFYKTLGYEAGEYTDKGTPRLDEQEVSRLVALEAPHAQQYQLLKTIESARTKWYTPYAAHTGWDGRLRTDYSQSTVQTGRLGSTRVNLQAIPHDHQLPEVAARFPTPRQLLRPREGARLWELDLSQAELRVSARTANCESVLQMLRDGIDVHGAIATQLFGVHPGDDEWDTLRFVGKRANFSFIFGISGKTFQAALLKLTGKLYPLKFCNDTVRDWRRLFPEYGVTNDWFTAFANHNGYVRLINGRPNWFNAWDDRTKAWSWYVQSSLAELMKQWMIETEAAFPGVMLLTIHDSLVLETNDEGLVIAVQQMGEGLGSAMFDVPMIVDLKQW